MPQHASERTNEDLESYFRYTSGRWLWDEEEQLRRRYRKFNVEHLQQIAAKASGARRCISMSKLNEGNSNKAFRLVMENSTAVIAKIPSPNAGPPKLTTASEVATMDFARTVLHIPVPKVLAWDADVNNHVESEYMVMEEAQGTQLAEVWEDASIDDKISIAEDLARLQSQMICITFSRYGALYFTHSAHPASVTAEVISHVPEHVIQDISSRFVVGPVVSEAFWDPERTQEVTGQGPWLNSESYLKSIAERELAWLVKHAKSHSSNSISAEVSATPTVSSHRQPQQHAVLYERLLKIIAFLVEYGKSNGQPCLWHWDMRPADIFVEDGRISRYREMIFYTGEKMLKLPSSFKDIGDEEKRQALLTKVEKSLIQHFYIQEMYGTNPDMVETWTAEQSGTIEHLMTYSENSWRTGLPPFRQCLITLWMHWDQIAPNTECPIHFTDKQLRENIEDGKLWNANQDFWSELDGVVSRDGWVTLEDYEKAIEIFQAYREEGLKTLQGEERSAFEESMNWLPKAEN
ncbi:Phosphotransferase enzyme [Vermiconidia calcicola]|uniref:Phosphotransferase enzyme n=1 Tax=Vermiconidia calcicola TaxID=1690605 RepID=A0ACC3MK11_9PEZI|nr:Phosphotransferase enzyme [Vermiconidia calcicola]